VVADTALGEDQQAVAQQYRAADHHSGVVMKTQTSKPVAAARLEGGITVRADALSWRRLQSTSQSAPRALFAAPPPDLLTLVIADQIKRRAQAEIQRDALREALYDMPAQPERHEERGTDAYPSDADEE
jgi:hypothetical protein